MSFNCSFNEVFVTKHSFSASSCVSSKCPSPNNGGGAGSDGSSSGGWH